MGRLLIIGCGGVAGVAIHKCCQNSKTFTEICIASRTKSKCDALKEKLEKTTDTVITTAQVDADNTEELIALIKKYQAGCCVKCCFAISGFNNYGCLPCMQSRLYRYRKL